MMYSLSLILCATIIAVFAGDHGHQGYFQYANVPAYGQYEFGYNRGNPYHYTSRYEQGHDWRFRSKVRWGDKYGGYGEHYYDYNHVDKGHKGKGHQSIGHGHGHGGYGQQTTHGWGNEGYGHSSHGHGHGHGHGAFSEISPAVIPGSNPK